jgi:phytoene synthase
MSVPLEHSYSYCRQVARRRARNFYYSFVLLPRPKRDAICAVYAFMRHCDDLSDAPDLEKESARAALEQWRSELDAALDRRHGQDPVWPALDDTVRKHSIPRQYLYDMIEGVSSDLEPRRIATFDELYRYCYQVASVVGLTVIHIFGYRSAEALPLAEKCGVAFQLTNILRDVGEDTARGRVYIPVEDLERFGVHAWERSENFVELMRFQAARARAYYAEARPLLGMIEPSCRSSLWALIEIYSRLLERIERSGFDVLSRRISLPGWQKTWIVLRGSLSGGML